MDTEVLTPALFSDEVNAAEIIGGQRRVIEVAAMLIGPFQAVLAQDLCKAIKKYGIIRADGVVKGQAKNTKSVFPGMERFRER